MLFTVLLVLIFLRSCLTSAEKRLFPSVYVEKTGELRDPAGMNLCFNEKLGPVDPFLQYD